MAYMYVVDPASRLGAVRLEGQVTGDQVAEVSLLLFRHPDWQPGFCELWDARGITELLVTLEEVRRVAAIEKEHLQRMGMGRVAIVVARDIEYYIGRLYTAFVRDTERPVRLFKSIDKAQHWLGLSSLPPLIAAPDDRERRTS